MSSVSSSNPLSLDDARLHYLHWHLPGLIGDPPENVAELIQTVKTGLSTQKSSKLLDSRFNKRMVASQAEEVDELDRILLGQQMQAARVSEVKEDTLESEEDLTLRTGAGYGTPLPVKQEHPTSPGSMLSPSVMTSISASPATYVYEDPLATIRSGTPQQEDSRVHRIRMSLWHALREALINQLWLFEHVHIGDIATIMQNITNLIVYEHHEPFLTGMTNLMKLSKTGSWIQYKAQMAQIQTALAKETDPTFSVGPGFIRYMFLRGLTQDPRYVLETTLIRDNPTVLPLAQTINRLDSRSTMLEAGTTTPPGLQAFLANTRGPGRGTFPNWQKPCFGLRDHDQCKNGDRCPFSHDPQVIAESRESLCRKPKYGGGGYQGTRSSGPPKGVCDLCQADHVTANCPHLTAARSAFVAPPPSAPLPDQIVGQMAAMPLQSPYGQDVELTGMLQQ